MMLEMMMVQYKGEFETFEFHVVSSLKLDIVGGVCLHTDIHLLICQIRLLTIV